MSSLSQLKPIDEKEVKVYAPFCPENKRRVLPHAISLYRQKSVEGARKIEGGEDIPFVATWNMTMLPIDLTRCRIQFDNNADLSYETTLQTSDFINYLIELLLIYQRTGKTQTDFPKPFYRKLLRLDE